MTASPTFGHSSAPDTIIHYAEQPSAPYSMRGFPEARRTFKNNLDVTFNCIWAMLEHAPKAHLVKLGTMGEYGTPNIDIEEGWIDIDHKGRTGRFLFPRAAGSLYHTTKVLDTDLLWFYVRTYGLRVTDLMQGPGLRGCPPIRPIWTRP
ncbi:NAD-dependent epimerase/dehydratase family protein [Profundibacter sp.]|uniref:NAD-dependent epimerase/dehydratase family protein n=1 Tax=Profundibacter sp. TaxID=3101071 RepID=UPI003D115016